jgi:hypothetical protein
MYAQILLVTSVRGIGVEPMIAASGPDGVRGFMNAAFGLRAAFLAAFFGAAFFAVFLAGAAFFAVVFFAVAFFAGAFFAVFFAAFLAVAINFSSMGFASHSDSALASYIFKNALVA